MASSRRISQVALVTLQPAAANGQLFLTRFGAPRIPTTCIGSPPAVGADL